MELEEDLELLMGSNWMILMGKEQMRCRVLENILEMTLQKLWCFGSRETMQSDCGRGVQGLRSA